MPLLPLLWLLVNLLGCPVAGQPIRIGMSGPMRNDIGNNTAAGLAFALEEANRAGGVMGRNLSLVALNDDYNTTIALANIQRLLDVEDVLLLASMVGSDVALQAKPLILQRGVPYVGAMSGAPELHTPFQREFVNVRASFADEMVAHALFLVQTARVQRVACLYQNDSFGTTSLAALVAALANVGITLVASGTYTHGQTDVEGAVAAIAGAASPAQAVVLVALQDATIRFIARFHADPRADPDCVFTVMSPGWGSPGVLDVASLTVLAALWNRVYFFFVVPLPGDPAWAIATHFADAFTAAGHFPDPLSFEGYITGRLIVDVLLRTRSANPSRAMFLNEVYNDRLFVLDDLVVGMYSTNYSGCAQALCSCNAGLRSLFASQLNPTTFGLAPSLSHVQYSVLQCHNPVTSVIAPLLFGQLVPDGDAGWRAVALDIGRGIAQAFAEANAAGGAGSREFVLLQQNYSTNGTPAMNRLVSRYPLAALLGGVVPDAACGAAPIATLGTLHMEPETQDDAFARQEVHLQAATSLELMALAQWAALYCPAVHLRAPASDTGRALLVLMTKSIHSFQVRPASASTYAANTDVLASTASGCLIALGSDADVLSWYTALPGYPELHLLTVSAAAMRLMAVYPAVSSAGQASRLHFPTLAVDAWNTTLPAVDPGEPWKYGYILGTAVAQALTHSRYAFASHTTPAELLDAWYTVKVMTTGTLTLGPYYGEPCATGQAECECNEGVRTLAVRSVASAALQARYSISSCHVAYLPLLEVGSDATVGIVVGVVVGVVGCLAVALGLYLCLTRRNHSAAPKDVNKPFCILFTDIQASTHLWATVPDIMAPALNTHHALIRRLLAKHRCYEVKTIGDSFMCAAHTPLQAMQFALDLQTTLHEYDWGTHAIDAAYYEAVDVDEPGRVSHHWWNGLRVRVGMHYGQGDIQFDRVSKGYDYYGTVVNTAARIESVCHGGQVGVSQEVFDAVHKDLPEVVWVDLGVQPLRGLGQGIHLYQALPEGPLASRTFPPLRLDRQQD
eukprot:EG_transcript_1833